MHENLIQNLARLLSTNGKDAVSLSVDQCGEELRLTLEWKHESAGLHAKLDELSYLYDMDAATAEWNEAFGDFYERVRRRLQRTRTALPDPLPVGKSTVRLLEHVANARNSRTTVSARLADGCILLKLKCDHNVRERTDAWSEVLPHPCVGLLLAAASDVLHQLCTNAIYDANPHAIVEL